MEENNLVNNHLEAQTVIKDAEIIYFSDSYFDN